MLINTTRYRDYLSNTIVSNYSKSNGSIDNKTSTTVKNKDTDVNIQNATFDEFKGVIHDLHQSGKISFLELATYVFQPMKGNTIASGRYYDGGNKTDWLAEFKTKSSSNLKGGNLQSYIEDQKLLKILTE